MKMIRIGSAVIFSFLIASGAVAQTAGGPDRAPMGNLSGTNYGPSRPAAADNEDQTRTWVCIPSGGGRTDCTILDDGDVFNDTPIIA